MSIDNSRRDFILKSAYAAAAISVTVVLAACGGLETKPAQFNCGVASGDPLSERVILWTDAKIADSNDSVGLTWEVATDAAFASVVRSGRVDATAATSFTAKVDATGLTAG